MRAENERERIELSFGWPVVCLIAAFAFVLMALVFAQAAYSIPPGIASQRGGPVKREWTDPCLGSRWQLQMNAAHPGGPGRLVLLEADPRREVPVNRTAVVPGDATQQPMAIRSGERVTVDQDNGILHARFAAFALDSARMGERIRVRLTAPGLSNSSSHSGVVTGVVTGAGLVAWRPEEAGR